MIHCYLTITNHQSSAYPPCNHHRHYEPRADVKSRKFGSNNGCEITDVDTTDVVRYPLVSGNAPPGMEHSGYRALAAYCSAVAVDYVDHCGEIIGIT